MEPVPKLSAYAKIILQARMRAFWELLKMRFAAQSEDALARAEERHRGRNEP
jgi:hypothetical protein